MVFNDSQAFIERVLASFVIGGLDRKYGRSNQGSEVRLPFDDASFFGRTTPPDFPVIHVPGKNEGASHYFWY
jgi:hypothetical protein